MTIHEYILFFTFASVYIIFYYAEGFPTNASLINAYTISNNATVISKCVLKEAIVDSKVKCTNNIYEILYG